MKSSICLILVAAAGCGGGAGLSSTTAELTVISHDCDPANGGELDSYTPGTGGIGVVGIFKSRFHDLPDIFDPEDSSCRDCWSDPTCDIDTHCLDPYKPHPASLQLSGPQRTWVVSADSPTYFTITVEPGAAVERIILTGVAGVDAVAPAGIPVEIPEQFIGGGWDWYTDEELAAICAADPSLGCTGGGDDWRNPPVWFQEMQSRNLVANAEAYLDDSLSAFYGCEAMSELKFGSP